MSAVEDSAGSAPVPEADATAGSPAASVTEDEEEDADTGSEASIGPQTPQYREVRGQLRPMDANARMSPMEVHFSQMRARERFRCNRPLEQTVPEIRLVLDSGGDEPEPEADGETKKSSRVWRLETPFPPIEVIKWRCKLRDGQTGRPKVDPETGGDIYDEEDRWFTLDNRRLYCLQRAAVSVWPDRAEVDVIELPPGPLARSRELRKFRTLDRGRSVFIGGRGEGEELKRWSWQAEVGIQREADADGDVDAATAAALVKRRPSGQSVTSGGGSNRSTDRTPTSQGRQTGRFGSVGNNNRRPWVGNGQGGRDGRYGQSRKAAVAEEPRGIREYLSRISDNPAGGFLTFLAIYFVLRTSTKLLQIGFGYNPGSLPEALRNVSSLPLTVAGLVSAAVVSALVVHVVLR